MATKMSVKAKEATKKLVVVRIRQFRLNAIRTKIFPIKVNNIMIIIRVDDKATSSAENSKP